MKTDKGYYYTVKCQHCGIEYLRGSTRKDKRYFCTPICWRQQLLKENDLLGYKILDHIDTPNFCYLIGLIATDGHINIRRNGDDSGNNCKIQLKADTAYILESVQNRFGGFIVSSSPRTKAYPIWCLNNKRFNDYLVNTVGLTQNKTLTLDVRKWFSALTTENKNHFLRGVIDGDGSISIALNDRGFPDYRVVITSASIIFLEMIADYLGVGSIVKTKSKAWNLVISAKKAVASLADVFNISEDDIHHRDKLEKFKIIQQHVQRNLDREVSPEDTCRVHSST